MSPKSIVVAKVLGGSAAGASGVVGASYGLSRYFKSEETTLEIKEQTDNGVDNEGVVSEITASEENQDLSSDINPSSGHTEDGATRGSQVSPESGTDGQQVDASQKPSLPEISVDGQSTPSVTVEKPASSDPNQVAGTSDTDTKDGVTITDGTDQLTTPTLGQ